MKACFGIAVFVVVLALAYGQSARSAAAGGESGGRSQIMSMLAGGGRGAGGSGMFGRSAMGGLGGLYGGMGGMAGLGMGGMGGMGTMALMGGGMEMNNLLEFLMCRSMMGQRNPFICASLMI